MKNLKFILALLIPIFFTGCSDDDDDGNVIDKEIKLTEKFLYEHEGGQFHFYPIKIMAEEEVYLPGDNVWTYYIHPFLMDCEKYEWLFYADNNLHEFMYFQRYLCPGQDGQTDPLYRQQGQSYQEGNSIVNIFPDGSIQRLENVSLTRVVELIDGTFTYEMKFDLYDEHYGTYLHYTLHSNNHL